MRWKRRSGKRSVQSGERQMTNVGKSRMVSFGDSTSQRLLPELLGETCRDSRHLLCRRVHQVDLCGCPNRTMVHDIQGGQYMLLNHRIPRISLWERAR